MIYKEGFNSSGSSRFISSVAKGFVTTNKPPMKKNKRTQGSSKKGSLKKDNNEALYILQTPAPPTMQVDFSPSILSPFASLVSLTFPSQT